MALSPLKPEGFAASRTRRRLVRALAALGIAATLGGCIVVPVGGHGYYHRPRPYYYY